MNKHRKHSYRAICGLASNFWLMPSLMVAGSIAFVVVLIELDSTEFNQQLT